MNTAGQLGGALSSVLFGYIVKSGGGYDAPLIPMGIFLACGMLLWGRVDVTQNIALCETSGNNETQPVAERLR